MNVLQKTYYTVNGTVYIEKDGKADQIATPAITIFVFLIANLYDSRTGIAVVNWQFGVGLATHSKCSQCTNSWRPSGLSRGFVDRF
jgi:hypothetical protein